MFYGGIALAGCSLIALIIYFIVSHIKKTKLDFQLDEEYGKK